jgi:hypothetical protein
VKSFVHRLPGTRGTGHPPNDDEALGQGHEELGGDDGKRDDQDDRGDTGDEARKEAIE